MTGVISDIADELDRDPAGLDARPITDAATAPLFGATAARVTSAVIAVTFWIVLPVLCLWSVAIGADQFLHNVNNIPSGTRGAFYVTSQNCQRQLCITSGTFTSDDGSVIEPGLIGVYRWPLGTTHGAVYNADEIDVIPLPAVWDPTPTVIGTLGALGFLGVWGLCLRAERRRVRLPEPFDHGNIPADR